MFRFVTNNNVIYYLYTTFILLVGAGALVFFYFMVTGFNIGVYDENTVIGGVYVGGLDEEEAEEKVRARLLEWLEDDEIVFEVGYQGYYYQLDRELFTFDVSSTMQLVNEGGSTDLIVNYSAQARDTIISDMQRNFFDTEVGLEDFGLLAWFDLEEVLDDSLEAAANLRRLSRMELSDYLVDEALFNEELSSVELPMPAHVDAAELHHKLVNYLPNERYEIDAFSVHHLLDVFDDRFTSRELNVIGGLIQGVILPTNMYIQESHYNPQIDFNRYTIDDFPYYGFNVRLNRNVNYDYIFENHGYNQYHIEFILVDDETLEARLFGPPFLNEITVETHIEFIDPPVEQTGNPDEAQDGIQAVHVSVQRTKRDVFGDIVHYGNDAYLEIVFEFYPSVTEVVYIP